MLFLAAAVHFPLLAQQTTVPFVGCKSDGQAGPMDAPTGKPKVVSIPAASARRLAYYQAAQGAGVLAPRGWYCFGFYGSGGATLNLAPDPRNFWGNDPGPAIEVSSSSGGTSGRFEVAEVASRVFPKNREFVRAIEEEIQTANPFPSVPHPTDVLVYKSDQIVEYETPSQVDGLGTYASLLRKGDRPIRGVAILIEPALDLVRLSVRLPADLNDLTSAIIQQTEHDASSH